MWLLKLLIDMSEKIIVKLSRDNISVSSCKEGVYLTFDAENARPIICKYSEVITIFPPNQIYNADVRPRVTFIFRES